MWHSSGFILFCSTNISHCLKLWREWMTVHWKISYGITNTSLVTVLPVQLFTQRNKRELFVSCIHFHNCSWVNWGCRFQILHHFYSIRPTLFATACFFFATINYTRQQNQYFPLLQKLFKLFLSTFWALILNLGAYLLQKLKFLNYIFIYTIYPYTTNLKIVEIILSKALK